MDLTSCLYKIYICNVKDKRGFVHPLTFMKLKRNAFVTLIPITCQLVPIACTYIFMFRISFLFNVISLGTINERTFRHFQYPTPHKVNLHFSPII